MQDAIALAADSSAAQCLLQTELISLPKLTWRSHEVAGMVQKQGTQPGAELLTPGWLALQALYRCSEQLPCICGSQAPDGFGDHARLAHSQTPAGMQSKGN